MNAAARLAGARIVAKRIGDSHPCYEDMKDFLSRYEGSTGDSRDPIERLVGIMALLRFLQLKGYRHMGEARSFTGELLAECAPESELEYVAVKRAPKSRRPDSVSRDGKSSG